MATGCVQEEISGFGNYVVMFMEAFYNTITSDEISRLIFSFSAVQLQESVKEDTVDSTEPLIPAFVIKCFGFFYKVLSNLKLLSIREVTGVDEFFTPDRVKNLFQVLVTRYLPMKKADFEYWESDPER